MSATQATSYSLKYNVSGANGASTTITAATLIADAAAGPLKTLLQSVNAGLTVPGVPSGWTSLGTSKQLSVYFTPTSDSGASGGSASVAFTSSPSNNIKAVFVAAGGDTIAGVIEIRFYPSNVA